MMPGSDETERAREALEALIAAGGHMLRLVDSGVEAADMRAAIKLGRAALSAPATEPELRGQGANEAWRFCSHCGAAQWEGGTDPNPNSITLPAVPVASSEESEK